MYLRFTAGMIYLGCLLQLREICASKFFLLLLADPGRSANSDTLISAFRLLGGNFCRLGQYLPLSGKVKNKK
jgi:hypothetical protein